MVYGFAAEEYLLLLETLGDFMEKEIEPTAREIDLKARFPTENMTKLFEQGFTSMSFPKETVDSNSPGQSMPPRWKRVAKHALALHCHWPSMVRVAKAYDYSVLPSRRKSIFPRSLRVKCLLRSRSLSPGLDRMLVT